MQNEFRTTDSFVSTVEPGLLRGGLKPETLARTFRELEVHRAEGILYTFASGDIKSVYFRDGRIVFASSESTTAESASESESESELASESGAESPSDPRENEHDAGNRTFAFGEATRIDTSAAIVYSLFALVRGDYCFEARPLPPRTPKPFDLSPTEAVVEGLKRCASRTTIDRILGDLSGKVYWNDSQPDMFPESTLATDDSKFVGLLKEHGRMGLPVQSLLEQSSLSREETLARLCALVGAGIVRLQAEPSESAGADEAGTGQLPWKLGRFDVLRLLGRGSMGTVFLAHDPAMDRIVAVKLIQLPADLNESQREKYRHRFYREASAAGQLSHGNIVGVYDVGHTDDGAPFIVMEYVEGQTLRELLDGGRLTMKDALRIAQDVLDGLGYAHEQGIVHRDVKPSNILVTPDQRAKIMDFGIAHVVGSELTAREDMLGSPYYMAPEQFSKDTIDQRTDLFAFAVVMYRMLTGEHPFAGESIAAIALSVMETEPRSLVEHDREIHPELDGIVSKCLAKRPEKRYERAGDVANDLTNLEFRLENDPIASKKLAKPKTKVEAQAQRPWGSYAAALLLGALLVLGATFAIDESYSTSSASSSGSAMSAAVGPDVSPLAPDVRGIESPTATRTATAAADSTTAQTPFGISAEAYQTPAVPAKRPSETAGARAPTPIPATALDPAPAPAPAFEKRIESAREPSTSTPAAPLKLTSAKEDQGTRARLSPSPDRAMPTPNDVGSNDPTEAELFYQARISFERGRLTKSRSQLNDLLRRNPNFDGASELMAEVRYRLWLDELPMRFEVRHDHQIGSCEGQLTLDKNGVTFRSGAHSYGWEMDDVRLLERLDMYSLRLETYDETLLGIGKFRSFNFQLDPPMRDTDWTHYRRLVQ